MKSARLAHYSGTHYRAVPPSLHSYLPGLMALLGFLNLGAEESCRQRYEQKQDAHEENPTQRNRGSASGGAIGRRTLGDAHDHRQDRESQ